MQGVKVMTAITKTKEVNYDTNLIQNQTMIFVCRKAHASQLLIDWEHKDLIYWTKYSIKESDMRQETASFTSPQYFDLTTGVYCVLISSPYHKNFGGIILSNEYDEDNGLYTYQCQDFSRVYQSKFELVTQNLTLHRILKYLLSRGGIPPSGTIKDELKQAYSEELSGLRPAHQYEQKYYGASKNSNPMTEKLSIILKDKTFIEAIRDLVYGTGAYIDVYFDQYGVCHINPYHKDDLKKGLVLSANTTTNRKFKFDTTNIITGTVVKSEENLAVGGYYSSTDMVNLDLTAFFGDLTASISNPNKNNKTTTSNGDKKSTTTTNTNNPYNTKKKKIYISSDNINGKSSDNKFMQDVANKLKKQGWTTKIIGLGPNSHYYPNHAKSCKDGVWFCIFGGADAAVFKQCITNNAYTNALKKNNCRTVIGMHGGGDIRKGGKYYKYLPRAHDDNYSPSSFKGLSNPLSQLTKGKVPIMYASNAEQMVSKFLAGGDNKEAC